MRNHCLGKAWAIPSVIASFALLFSCAKVIAESKRKPNVLLAISDDQSQMHAGAYGDKATRTPAFDRIAKEGALFNHAYCAAPSCAPSRAALLTGRYPWELEEAGNLFGILKSKFPIFTHALEDAGYQTACTGKTWGPGRLGKGWKRPLFMKTYNKHKINARRRGLNPNDYAANFEQFFSERDKDMPFFFWLGTTEPHQNYDVGAWKKAGKKLQDARLPGCLPDNPITRGEILDYGLEIEHFDHHLARVIKILEKAGELDNTLIVVTSDHGNPMPRSKCNLYDSGTCVPLAIRLPGQIPKGRTIDDFVSLVDLAPTFLEVARAKSFKVVSGGSLWSILASTKSGQIEKERDYALTGLERHIICRRNGVGYPMRCLRTKDWAYVRNYEPDRWPAGDPDFNSSHQGFFGDCDRGESKRFILENSQDPKMRPYFLRAFGRRPSDELYNVKDDPDQLHNLALDPKHAETKKKLAERLASLLKTYRDPRQSGKALWDTYPFTDQRIFKHPRWRTEGFPSKLPK